ncbi:unnamed protein product [Candida verbasci]|uniref:Altered inheritance of mitochondria protein 6 n=1 Tax=Candida verbasci TaxID=1227364 RepID=A0A9W4XLX4_9ASCO|nr:unnamed protein product [Candida verbasci]
MISVFKPSLVSRDYTNATLSSSIFQFNGSTTNTPEIPINYTIEGLTRDVYPKPLHSHNDYWRYHPFYDALGAGAVSIESDVWYFPQDYELERSDYNKSNETLYFNSDEIYVGHNQIYLRPIDTLFNLYLNPLLTFLNFANPEFQYTQQSGSPFENKKYGVFYNDPEQQVYLWFDFKNDANSTYDQLKKQIQPFIDKGYLTYYNSTSDSFVNNPLILTITGNLPIEKVQDEETRYLFLDGPLQNFTNGTSEDDLNKWSKLSRVVSSSLESLIKDDNYQNSKKSNFTDSQKFKLKEYFDKAHEYGLKTRIWGDITWPINTFNSHLQDFYILGSDLLNVDDLQKAKDFF